MDGADIETERALVERVAKQVKKEFGRRTEMDDLVQAGFEGLVQARSRFDATREVSFEAWAYRRIRGAMLDQVRRDQRLPRGFHDECRRAAKLEAALEQATEDVAKRPPKGPVDAARQMSALLGQATITYVADLAAGAERDGTEDGIITQVDAANVRDAIEELPEPLKSVILAYIYEDESLAEIGEAKGKSERWARHTLQEALEMLREMFRDG